MNFVDKISQVAQICENFLPLGYHSKSMSVSLSGVIVALINPRRMRRRVTVVVLCACLCVCVSVCYQASCYIPYLYVESEVSLGFSWRF